MTIDVKRESGALFVKLNGRLDSLTSSELQTTFEKELDENVSELNVDLTAVDFVSSKGLRVLVSAYKRLNGGEMIITGANASVTEVFRLSGLLKIFTLK